MNLRTLFSVALMVFAVAGVRAQSADAGAVSPGAAAYEMGRYDEALSAAKATAKDRNASASQRVEAFRLQGLAYTALGQQKKAQKAVDQMVLLNPSYQARPSDSPAFAALVTDAQQRHADGKLKFGKKGPSQMIYNVAAGAMSVLTIYLGISAAMAM